MKKLLHFRKALMIAALVVAGIAGMGQCTPPVPTLSGETLVCPGDLQIYCTDTGMTNYVWTVNGGSVIAGGGINDNCITIGWGSSPVEVCVSYTDTAGCTPVMPTCLTIIIKPPIVPTVFGSNPVCPGDTSVYCTQPGMSNYIWTVNGGIIASGVQTECIMVVWGPNPVSVCVNYSDTSFCLSPNQACLNISINPPITPVITGPNIVCPNSSGNVYCTDQGMSNYNWTISGGNNTSGMGTNCITVDWGANPVDVCVMYFDPSGCFASPGCLNIVPCSTQYFLKGNVFYDANNNGAKDAGENGLSNVIVKTKAANWVFNSDINGDYTALSNTLNDTVAVVNPSIFSTATPSHYILATSDSGKNFAIYYPIIQDLRITITNLTPARPGFDDVIKITYQNVGTTAMSGNVTLDFNNNFLNYVSSNPAQTSINGNVISWDYTNLQPFEQRNITATFNVKATTPLNTVLNFTGTVYPITGDTVPADNHNSIEQVVIGSFDPNDKEVIPDDGLTPQDLANGDKLVYTIHFQNTGTDTAFNIKITDTLSAKVDAGTFELLSSSHPCTFNMKGAGIVDFVFNNIFLPDSNVNLVGSNGFVKYAVKPLSTLLLGDSVTNTAYIYFDFNSPVQTNTASSLIHLPVGIAEGRAEDGIYVYPNPASSLISIELASVGAQNLVPAKTSRCRVYDILGTEVINKTFTGNKFNLDVSKLSKGLYLLRVESGEGIMVRRFVKE